MWTIPFTVTSDRLQKLWFVFLEYKVALDKRFMHFADTKS